MVSSIRSTVPFTLVVLVWMACGGDSRPRDDDDGGTTTTTSSSSGTQDTHPRCEALCGAQESLCTGAEQQCMQDCESHISGLPTACATCLLEDATGWCKDINGQPYQGASCECISYVRDVNSVAYCGSVCG